MPTIRVPPLFSPHSPPPPSSIIKNAWSQVNTPTMKNSSQIVEYTHLYEHT